MEYNKNQTVGEIVTGNLKSASVFKKHAIDFCCQGNRSLELVCETQKINLDDLINELRENESNPSGTDIDFNTWPLDLLADYIEKKHHRYVDAQLLEIKPFLDKICQVHGERHPELFKIQELFKISAGEFTQHMKKEELILFPFIKKMVKAQLNHQELDDSKFGKVEQPIETMMNEHATEGERFVQISQLSNNYTPPSDACNTYRLTFSLLKEFEEDLHMHIHLENNILFPKAIAMQSAN